MQIIRRTNDRKFLNIKLNVLAQLLDLTVTLGSLEIRNRDEKCLYRTLAFLPRIAAIYLTGIVRNVRPH